MKLALKTPPASEPVTLAEVKKHLKLAVTDAEATAYTTEDAELSAFIATAREIVEARTGKRLITQTWYIYLDGWPSGKVLFLPYPPLQSATVKYKCVGDAGYDNEVSDVLVDTQCSPGRLVLPSGAPWPPSGDLYPVNPIQIEYKCGYGDSGADVPHTLRAAMLLIISDLYEHRGEVVIGAPVNRITDAIDSLLRQEREWMFTI